MKQSRLTGFELMRTTRGDVLQSGAKSRPNNHYQDLASVGGWVTRAVVLQVYYPDEEGTTKHPWASTDKQKCVLCDVRTYGRYTRFFSKVPVLQRTMGLWDEDSYVPRASTQNIETGGEAQSQRNGPQGPTAAEDLDGDHVLVGFLDNDPSQPVILPYTLPHPKAHHRPEKADGRRRRIRHNGTLVEWDDQGNLTIDATGAAQPELLKGAEQSNSGTGGKITLKTSDGTNQTSITLDEQHRILLGDGANQPLVLGNEWKTVMGQLIDAIKAITVQVPATPGPSTGPVLNAAQFDQIKASIANGDQVSDFVFTKKVP